MSEDYNPIPPKRSFIVQGRYEYRGRGTPLPYPDPTPAEQRAALMAAATERPKRKWLFICPGDGRLFCSICRAPERWNMVGICNCFEQVSGNILIDRHTPQSGEGQNNKRSVTP